MKDKLLKEGGMPFIFLKGLFRGQKGLFNELMAYFGGVLQNFKIVVLAEI
jgi:hypothetical protein